MSVVPTGTIPVPGTGESPTPPPPPGTITVPGTAPEPRRVSVSYTANAYEVHVNATGSTELFIELGTSALANLWLTGFSSGTQIRRITLPSSLIEITEDNYGSGVAQGPWVDRLIEALPDRSDSQEGKYYWSLELTEAQEEALANKNWENGNG